MSKRKLSKINFLFTFFCMLQLGACAKEVPVTVAQEVTTEQVQSIVEKPTEPVLNTTDVIKEKIVDASTEELRASQVSTNIQAEIKPLVQAEVNQETAAQAVLNLDQYKGKVVYLDFWASWCVPCQQTFPWMNAMQKKYPDDIVFVAVNFGESPDDTVEFLKRFPADIKFVYDPLIQIASEYGVPGLPYSFIYGRNGDLLGKHAGFSDGSEINLEAALKNLFASGK